MVKKKRAASAFYVAELNARLQPMHRGAVFEDPVAEALAEGGLAEVGGGGTLISPTNEVLHSDIEFDAKSLSVEVEDAIIGALEALGAPKGSALVRPDESRRPFGVAEGLALYVNGTDLAPEVYANGDINAVISHLGDAIGDKGTLLSYWEGATETALYYYGPSFDAMARAISTVVANEPLLERSRVVQIA